MSRELAQVLSLPIVAALPGDRRMRAFARCYWPAMHRALAARLGIRPELRDATSACVRHCAGETGWGSGLYNWNCGYYVWDSRPRPIGARSPYYFLHHDDAPIYKDGVYVGQTAGQNSRFEAMRSMDEGIARYLDIVFRSPLRKASLLHDPGGYFIALRGPFNEKTQQFDQGYLGGHGESEAQLRAAGVQGIEQVNADTADLQPGSKSARRRAAVAFSSALLVTAYALSQSAGA